MTVPARRGETPAAPTRRGACPSIATPMPTGDGLLVRLRPESAGLAADDLLAIARLARAHGNGLIEITARGNLQIRGLRAETVPLLAAGLLEAGIALHAGVAIEVPPLAGLDPAEAADPAPLAAALRSAVADAALALAPKLSIVVDGGGMLSLADAVADIRLDAVVLAGETAWRLSLGGDRAAARPVALLAEERAIAGVLTVLRALSALGTRARGRDLDCDRLRDALGGTNGPLPDIAGAMPPHPLGPHRIGGECILGLSPVYGQTAADRLAALAAGLADLGAREFRLAHHRSLLVRGLRGNRLGAAQDLARRQGFWSEADAPGRSVSACAGAAGCRSGTFDTHAAADALAALAPDLLDGSLDVHVSGCPKGCAYPAPAAVTLCGTASGVALVVDGRAGDPAGAIVPAAGLEAAIGRTGDLLRSRRMAGETARALLDRTPPGTLHCAYQGQT